MWGFLFLKHKINGRHKSDASWNKKVFQWDAYCPPQWPSLNGRNGGREGGVGPRVRKFEQVSSDNHQMSLAEGWVCSGDGCVEWGGGGRPSSEEV